MSLVLTGMNARIVTTVTLFAAFGSGQAASAADPQLVGLVMPDAKVLAGVNVDQAKGSPFGLYVLTQIQPNNSGLQQFIALTGFDPTRDVHELLAATNSAPGAGAHTGLLLARGNFDPATLTSLATSKGAVTEQHSGVTIVEDPKQTFGVAFLNSTLLIAGDVANVKAAIDRPSSGQSLPAAVIGQVNQWSNAEDAWFVLTVPPASLAPPPAAGSGNMATGIMQQIQQAGGGVKFGDSVAGTAAFQSDNAQDATQLANTLQFLVNMAQMQAANNPQAANLAQAVVVNQQGITVKVSVTLPQAQFQQLIQSQKKAVLATPHVGIKN
jgi:hypothetical protein